MQTAHNPGCKESGKTNTNAKYANMQTGEHVTHASAVSVYRQTDSWLAQQEPDWTVASFPSLYGVVLL